MSKLWLAVIGLAVAAIVAVALYLNLTPEQAVVTAPTAPGAPEQVGPEVSVQDDELVWGEPDAPVTIIEYASLTCPHCASFHEDIWPNVKAQLIDTGKARLVFRHFPLDQLALRASVMMRCAAPARRAPLLDVLFSTQETWARAENPVEALDRIGRSVGMTDQDLEACFQDQEVVDAVIAGRLEAEQAYEVNSTPSFVIGGKLYRGGMNAEQMTEVVDASIR